jgi:uncharacterized membrane protein
MYRLTVRRAATAVKASRLSVFIATLATASGAIVTLPLPTPLRVPFGLLLVFVLPGWALAHAASPRYQLSLWDGILATLGLSLAIATCSATLLAAAPVGLSRESFAALLSAVTVVLTIVATFRGKTNKRTDPRLVPRECPDLAKRFEEGGV